MEAELAVGIKAFANPNITRFEGFVKKRYSDFVVDEIDQDGQVAALSDVMYEGSVTAVVQDTKVEYDEAIDYTGLLRGELGELASEEQVDAIVDLLTAEEAEPFMTQSMDSKADRTKIHSAIRSVFGGQLLTDTVEDKVRVAKKPTTDAGRKRIKLDKRNFNDPNRLDVIRFVLRKEFMETLEAVQVIARRLAINPKDLSYAGTKDKRGVTTQYVTAKHMNPKRIASVNGMANGRITVSNISVAAEMLRLGDLSGNRFTLALREVTGNDLEGAVQSLATNGFVNYYGLQRFGTMCVKSCDIGMMLLQGEYQKAINMILDPRVDELDGMARDARSYWASTKDAKAAHDLFPFRYNAERQVLWHFHKQGNQNDLVGALLSISKELRLMYVHSVQSLVWNRLVSERIERFGPAPVVGDLVYGGAHITPGNIKEYTIFDVVMPLPGYDVKVPAGEVGQMYKDLVEQEFRLVAEDCFQPKTKALWDLPGALRLIMARPRDVEHSIGFYDEPDADLDAAKLGPEGKHKAVVISFSLPSSCYATMALREIMHSRQ